MSGEPAVLTPRSGRVKAARKLLRRASRLEVGRFLAEGPQAVREALRAPTGVAEVFATAAATERHADIHDAARGVPWHLIDDPAAAALSDTQTSQGIFAVCRISDPDLAAVLDGSPRIAVVCAHVRDPGNAGTVIRVADAAGADVVVLAGTSVDPFNGKTVRASVGSVFHLPVVYGIGVEETVRALSGAGMQVLAAAGQGDTVLDEWDDAGGLVRPTAWMFGNEAWGLPADEAALADAIVRVPIYGRAESLNLASAATVCLYTTARAQRRS